MGEDYTPLALARAQLSILFFSYIGHHQAVSRGNLSRSCDMLARFFMLSIPGEHVRISGVYQLVHLRHRSPHETFLWAGERFPCCRECGANVVYQFLRWATGGEHISEDEDFARGETAA